MQYIFKKCNIEFNPRESKTHVEQTPPPKSNRNTTKENENADKPMSWTGGCSRIPTLQMCKLTYFHFQTPGGSVFSSRMWNDLNFLGHFGKKGGSKWY